MRRDKPWPLKVENRIPGMRYALFPPTWMECSCGKTVKNVDSVLAPPPKFPTTSYRLQHGDNREAVYVLSLFAEFSVELERDMEEWTEKVHAYEERKRER